MLFHNENEADGIRNVMKRLHQYVPYHVNNPEKQAFRLHLHNLSHEAINSVQKCGHGEMSKGRMYRKQDKTHKQTIKRILNLI